MKMMFKVLLSINLAFCLLSSSTMAMEELKKGRIPSRPTTAQSVRGKSESRAATTTRGVKRPRITFKEAAKATSDAKAAALAAKKARLAEVAKAAKKAVTKPPQLGAGALTAQPSSSQKTTQVSEVPESTQVVVRKYDKGDQKGLRGEEQTSSSPLSLDSTSAAFQQRAAMTSLSEPLLRMILRFVPRNPPDPRDICRIARTSSTINRVIDEDHLFWGQIYHQNYPHALFNAMKPEDRELAVAQFKEELRHLYCPIDPENPGVGFGKAFKFYSKAGFVCAPFFYNFAAIAILLRHSETALHFFKSIEYCKNSERRRFNTEAILDALCFNDEVYEMAIEWYEAIIFSSFPGADRRVFDKYVDRGILGARYRRAALGGAQDWDRGYRQRDLDFAREEMNALCNLNYFQALVDRLFELAHGGRFFEKDPPAAAEEYERCRKIFNVDLDKLIKLKEVYTGTHAPRKPRSRKIDKAAAILWVRQTPFLPMVFYREPFKVR